MVVNPSRRLSYRCRRSRRKNSRRIAGVIWPLTRCRRRSNSARNCPGPFLERRSTASCAPKRTRSFTYSTLTALNSSSRARRCKALLNARQVTDVSPQRQSGGKSWRFDADQIDQQRGFTVDGYDEITFLVTAGHHARPDTRIGPPEIRLIQNGKKSAQRLEEHSGRRLLRLIVRFVSHRHFIRPHEQLSVRPRAEVDAFALRPGRQGGVHEASYQALLGGGNHLVILSPERTNAIFTRGQGEGGDVVGMQACGIDQAAGPHVLTVRCHAIHRSFVVDVNNAVTKRERHAVCF